MTAVPIFCPLLEFAQFIFQAHFDSLIWYVVLMQNDKTGACESVCWVFFLKYELFFYVSVNACVWMCESSVWYMVIFELALHGCFLMIWLRGVVMGFVWHWDDWTFYLILQCDLFFQCISSSVLLLWLAHPCRHIHVNTKDKTFADSGNSWQTLIFESSLQHRKNNFFIFYEWPFFLYFFT